MKLRIGVVGLGHRWQSRYIPALTALSDRFDVRAIYADVGLLAQQAAKRFEAEVVDGYQALIRRPDIDAILFLAADWSGHLPILAACDAGKAIFCATELAAVPAQARAIMHRVDSSGVAFIAEFARRKAPATVRLKELIATRLGPPRLVFCHAQRRRTIKNGLGSDIHGCPTAADATRQMIELVDWCRYVIDETPTSVVGVKHLGIPGNGDEFEMMTIDFSAGQEFGSGPLAHIQVSRYVSDVWPEAGAFRRAPDLKVHCERGAAFVDLPSTLVWFDEAGQHTESLDSDRPVGEQMLMQFHRAVTSLLRKCTDLDDLYAAMQIVEAAGESCRGGRRILLQGGS